MNVLGSVGSEPYPWPYDAPVPTRRLALVVCGWDDGWRDRSSGSAVTEENVSALALAVREVGGRVVAVGHPDGNGCPAPRRPLDADHECSAAGIDGFSGSDLDHVLRRAGCDHLVLVGHGLEAPVHSTMRSANDRGLECLLVPDACSPLDPGLVTATVSSTLMSGGIFGAVAPLSALCAALAPPTEHPIRRTR